MNPASKSKKKIGPRAAKVLLVVAGIGLVGYLGMSFLASYKEKQVDQAWAETTGLSMQDFQKKYLNVKENSALREMAKALEPLGFKGVYFKDVSGNGANKNTTPDLSEISDDLAKLDTGDELRSASEKGKAFLHQHATDLENLYAVILRNDPPQWKTDFKESALQPEKPSFLAVRMLAQIIAVDALEKEGHGKHKEALDALEAGLKFSQGISRHPTLVGCMMGVAIDGFLWMQVGHMKNVPGEWLQRNQVREYRQHLLIAFQTEAWSLSKIKFSDLYIAGGFQLRDVGFSDLPFLIRPYRRLCLADTSEVVRKMIVDFKQNGETGVNTSQQDPANLFSWYNIPGKERGTYSPEGAWKRTRCTMMLGEQAQIILQVKDFYYSVGSLPPAEKVTGLESAAIYGAKWEYIPGADGVSFSLRFNRQPSWIKYVYPSDNNFWLLPLDGKTFWKLKKHGP